MHEIVTRMEYRRAAARLVSTCRKSETEFDKRCKTFIKRMIPPKQWPQLGIDTLIGKATFVDSTTLSVESQNASSPPLTIEAKQGVVVCTGAKPKRPTSDKIEGIENVNYLTYEEVFDLDVLPDKLTVVGGGPVCNTFERSVCR